MLRNDAGGADAEIWEVSDDVKREDNPLGFVDHVGELGAEKVGVEVSGFVGAPIDSGLELGGSPGAGLKDNWGAAMFVLA
jgi:hypothetical protein